VTSSATEPASTRRRPAVAESDRYDRMNSQQLEDEATSRGLNLEEFQSLANNRERAQRLRDHDQARDADAEIAAQNAEAQRQQQEQQAQAQQQDQQARQQQQEQQNQAQQQAQTGSGQPQQADVAPYGDDQSLRNAQDAAAGNLQTDQSIDPSEAEQVGGDPAYTEDQEQNYNQDR
jgi:hypothetical protein